MANPPFNVDNVELDLVKEQKDLILMNSSN